MGQVLHGSAHTAEAVRRAIQLRQESVRAAAQRYGVSPTTVQKWRDRDTTTDAAVGPKEPRSTVLTSEEEAIVVAFLEPHKAVEKALVAVLQEAWITGVSTRRVDDFVQAMSLSGISKSSVPKLCKDIDARANACVTRPDFDAFPPT